MSDLLDSYRAPGPGRDEMVHATGTARAAWDQMADLADLHTWHQIEDARAEISTMLSDQWVRHGSDTEEAPWELDPLPVILDEVEWAGVETALGQRAELLDEILTDLYGPRRLITEGLIPADLVLPHPGFLRAVDGIVIPGPRQLFLHAADVAREDDGGWRVLADRTQAPSGLGFAMADRRAVAQVMAGLYRQARIRRIGPFFHALATALREVAPPSAGDAPRIAMLTPGPYSETAFDQGYLASMLGLALVQGEDLEVHGGRLWMRSLHGAEPVDVLLRRVDAEYCDPLDLRGDSRLGAAGLVQTAREGNLTVVNTLGSGVLENPALLAYLPQLCRVLRDEDLALPSTVTYWCGDRAMCSHVIANLGHLVIRHTAPGAPPIHGWELGADARASLSAVIAAQPRQWVGQEPVGASTTPTAGPGALVARPTTLRTFALARPGGYQVMSGGLAQVSGPQIGDAEVPSVFANDTAAGGAAAGATAKDLWVLSTEPQPVLEPWEPGRTDDDAPAGATGAAAEGAGQGGTDTISAGAAENLFWFGRYAERAEATVRLLQVVADLWADHHTSPTSPGGRSLDVLERVLAGTTAGGTPQQVLIGEEPGTVAFAVDRILRAATAVRDQLSSDTWQALATVNRALDRARTQHRRGGVVDLSRAVSRVTEGMLALAGIGAESMMRDVGWSLMEIGRRIERAQHLVMTLRACLPHQQPPAVEAGVLEALLIAHESAITYRRRFQRHARVGTFLDLLLLDRRNPRALAYQVEAIATLLVQVPTPVRDAGSRDQLLADLRDLLAEGETTVLSDADDDGHRAHLAGFLESLHWRLAELANEIARVHFIHPVPSQWLDAVGIRVPAADEATEPPVWAWGNGGGVR
ncbi:circularly permuted type 2 ATP-grasp protein [Pseudactinotalea sp. Z1739]|uniref:circularly permuted type 2 ATP-grasp protein n=1 Tax=Pseudactinotalea sp. Z1739 TaxID=3413028 RepID=UPI003C7A2E99